MKICTAYSLLLALALLIFGCKSVKDNAKFNFADGVYNTKNNGIKEQVYVENTDDSITIYALKKGWKRMSVKASSLSKRTFPQSTTIETIGANRYWQNSFDIDVLTIPLKLRPSASSFPKQLNNNLNGVVYLGYRSDHYRLSYDKNPIGGIHQKVKHYGISAGLITGFGITAMNPWVTDNAISIEYDGLVWSKGIAVIMGLDKITFGLVGSIDHLMDENKHVWRYQGKPYLGLAVGLNLN